MSNFIYDTSYSLKLSPKRDKVVPSLKRDNLAHLQVCYADGRLSPRVFDSRGVGCTKTFVG